MGDLPKNHQPQLLEPTVPHQKMVHKISLLTYTTYWFRYQSGWLCGKRKRKIFANYTLQAMQDIHSTDTQHHHLLFREALRYDREE